MTRVVVEHLNKHFAGKPPTTRDGRPRPRDRGGRVPRPARPERLRQDDDAALPRRAGDARRGPDLASATATCSTRRRKLNLTPGQAEHRDGVPVLRPVAAHDRAQEHRLPAKARKHRKGPRRRTGSRRRPRWSTARSCSTATRPSSAAASSSASRSPAASSPGPTSCCSTSRSATSTPACATWSRAQLHELHARLGFTRRVRDPRPERGARPRRPGRDHARRPHRAARHARSTSSRSRPRSTSPAFIGMSNRLPLVRARTTGGDLAGAVGRPASLRPAGRPAAGRRAPPARGPPARADAAPTARRGTSHSPHGGRLAVRRPPHGRRRRRSATPASTPRCRAAPSAAGRAARARPGGRRRLRPRQRRLLRRRRHADRRPRRPRRAGRGRGLT